MMKMEKKTSSKYWSTISNITILFLVWVLVGIAVQGGSPVLTYTGGYVVGMLAAFYITLKELNR